MASHIGIIGLSTMGGNLARNAASRGATVAVFNRTPERTDEFMKAHGPEGTFVACKSYEEMRKALPAPRAIVLMVKAGKAVDDVIEELLPHLEKNDIVIDGGNSLYRDSERREAMLAAKGIRFMGMGISGGEEGALKGPSMMPGGNATACNELLPLLSQMAAKDGEGSTCVTYIGKGGAGHFVKMVHNGIEYGIMQLIAEAYDLLKHEAGMSNDELAETFAHWNETPELQSYLIEITADIFRKRDESSGAFLVDLIRDTASQKGTGKWTVDTAMDYGVAIPTITAAVEARILSGDTEHRHQRMKELPLTVLDDYPRPRELLTHVRHALSLSILCAYSQGFDLMEKASEVEGWNLDLSEIARIWRGGCIIRADLLRTIQWSYGTDQAKAESAKQALLKRFGGEPQLLWRRAIATGVTRGVTLPAMSASLAYFDAYRRRRLPQNLVQAQRDYFGAHTFERTDKDGVFHAEWKTGS